MQTTYLTLEKSRENLVIYLLGAIQFVHILDFVILMPLGPMLMRTFGVSPTQFGLLVSSYTFAAGVANFLASTVADRFERKRMLQFCFVGFLVGTFLCAVAPNFELLLLARIVAGDDVWDAARYANAAAALSTTGYGAVAPIPTAAEVLAFLEMQRM